MLPTLLLAAVLNAEPQPNDGPMPNVEYTYQAMDAVFFALSDIQLVPVEDRPYTRWVWLPNKSNAAVQLTKFTTHTAVNRGTFFPDTPAVAEQILVRLNLRLLAPRLDKKTGKYLDLEELVALWDKMAATDSAFYLGKQIRVDVPEYLHTDGKKYRAKIVNVAVFGPHVDMATGQILQGVTKSTAPVCRYDCFNLNVLSNLDTGAYYAFAKVRKSNDPKVTDFELFAQDHGVNVKQFEELRADRRAGLLASDVTNKPRAVNEVQGPFGQFTWTEDIREKTIRVENDTRKHAIKTLLDGAFDATEAIAINARGLCDFALFDGKGKLVDSVPDDVAVDDTIALPGTIRLQPGVSCIVCHGVKNKLDDGFRTFNDDVTEILSPLHREGKLRNLVPDVKTYTADELDRLLGKYRGRLSRLDNARLQYANAVGEATGGATISEIATELQALRNQYDTQRVTAEQACYELGFLIQDQKAVKGKKPGNSGLAQKVLERYIPARPDVQDDPIIIALKRGRPVNRWDWRNSFPEAAFRVQQTREAEGRVKVSAVQIAELKNKVQKEKQ